MYRVYRGFFREVQMSVGKFFGEFIPCLIACLAWTCRRTINLCAVHINVKEGKVGVASSCNVCPKSPDPYYILLHKRVQDFLDIQYIPRSIINKLIFLETVAM